MVVPFTDVACVTDHFVTRTGRKFVARLEFLSKPEGKWSWRAQWWGPGSILDRAETIRQWAFVNRFMDTRKPLPQEPEQVWEHIKWFQQRGISLDTVVRKKGYAEFDPSNNWIVWDGTAPEYEIDPQALKEEYPEQF